MSVAVAEERAESETPSARTTGVWVDVLIAIAFVVGTVAARYVVGPADFVNDGYMILLSGLHVLAGETPGIDFTALPYEMLSYWTAFELQLADLGIHVDFFFSALFIGIGAGATYLAGRVMGLTRLQAIYAPLMVILLYPRLYNYFKIVALGVLALAIAFYFRRPGVGRSVGLGLATALCLLVRMDIGLLAALASGLTILLNVATPITRSLRAGAAFVATVLPAAAIVLPLTLGGLGGASDVGDPLAETIANALFPFRVGDDLPAFEPLIIAPASYEIRIQYRRAASDAERMAFEAEHRLGDPVAINDTVVTYRIAWYSRSGIRAIVEAPLVDATVGIDRENYLIDGESLRRFQLRSFVGAVLAIPIAGIIAPAVYGVLFAALAWVAGTFLLRIARHGFAQIALWFRDTQDARLLFVFVWMGFFGLLLLVRGSWDSRLPDVGPIIALTVVFLIWRIAGSLYPLIGRFASNFAFHGIMLLCVGATFVFGVRYGNVDEVVEAVWVPEVSLVELVSRRTTRFAALAAGAITDVEGVGEPRQRLARYIASCTAPTDRLLMTFHMPEVPFWANRLSAAGRLFFHSPWGPGGFSEQDSIAQLGQQSVPLVISIDWEDHANGWPEFNARYPETAAYVAANYQHAATETFGGGPPFMIFVDPDATEGGGEFVTDGGVNLPCPHPQNDG